MTSLHASCVGRWARSRRFRLGIHALAIVGLLSLLLPTVAQPPTAHAVSFSNATSIAMSSTAANVPASPYPSTINVSGLTGVVSKVTVTLRNLTHTFPDDMDILLVGPAGANAVIMSDVGGGDDANNLTITLDDAAASSMSDATALSSGTFKPTNVQVASNEFPPPAPQTDITSTLAIFNLTNPNGDWKLFVVDDAGGDTGTIAGGWSLEITTQPAPRLMISEVRFNGPAGENDEFIEIYNASDVPHVVTSRIGGFYIVLTLHSTIHCGIPDGTTIPARGHFICVNSNGYGLGSYPAGNGTTATGDLAYTINNQPTIGVGLFDNVQRSDAVRFDSVGTANVGFAEGTGLPPLPVTASQFSIVRVFGDDGRPQDTDNNIADFLVVSTDATDFGNGFKRLGAPGPENLSSPTYANAALAVSPLDPCVSALASPNQVRATSGINPQTSSLGTLDLRRTITNNSGQPITRLRFRIVGLSTLPSPVGAADLRAVSSPDVSAEIHGAPCSAATSTVTIRGTTLEQPPTQLMGGGINSSLSVSSITPATPFVPGASIDVRFLLGVQQAGVFQFKVVMEALPAGGGPVISVDGTTEAVAPVTLSVSRAGTGQGVVASSPAGINCGTTCVVGYAPGTLVTLTATPNSGSTFTGWTGTCTGSGACQVTMDTAKAVTATFQRPNVGVVVGPGVVTAGDKTLTATLTARSGCGSIVQVRFGSAGQPFDNARVGISAPGGGPTDQTSGFTYTPPAGTTSISLTIQRIVQSGGATVTPIIFNDNCGAWTTFVGGGPSAFQ